MVKKENHQNKKLEQVQKNKKTGRIVTQLLFENHLFGRNIGQRWCCIHAFCYSSIMTDDNNEKIIKGPSRHVADEHAISGIEIDVMISFNQLRPIKVKKYRSRSINLRPISRKFSENKH